MTNKEFNNRLKGLRTVRPAVVPNALWISETRNMLMAKAKADALPAGQNQLIASVVLPRGFGHRMMFVMRPVMACFLLIGIAVAGWAAGVSSSLGNKPGTPLYGLKTAAERTQLTFAATPTARAYLHLELAGRRANEVAALAESDDAASDNDMATAMAQLQKEIASVGVNLDAVKAAKADDTVAVAKAVDRKVAEIRTIFGKTKHLLGTAAQTKAQAVEAAADDVSLKAVAVLVASAKSTEDKTDAATRVKERIDTVKSSLEAVSTEAGAQAKEAIAQAQAALESDNLAEAVVKVQDAVSIQTEEAEEPAADVEGDAAPPVSAGDKTEKNVNAGKIKAIGF